MFVLDTGPPIPGLREVFVRHPLEGSVSQYFQLIQDLGFRCANLTAGARAPSPFYFILFHKPLADDPYPYM